MGWLDVELSLPIFRLALGIFIPWRGADGFDRRAGLLVSNKFDLADEMGNLSWGYWHALCATPHIAAVHFGAAIEMLIRQYVATMPDQFPQKIIDDAAVWNSFRVLIDETVSKLEIPEPKKARCERISAA